MITLLDVPFEFDRELYNTWIKLERYGDLTEELDQLLREAVPLVKPRIILKECLLDDTDGNDIFIEGSEFHSPVLAWNLNQTNKVWPYVITCGREIYDRLQIEEDPLRKYWLDTLAELAVQFASDYITDYLKKNKNDEEGSLTFMNPGSADLDIWPLTDQVPLFDLIGDVKESIGVTLTSGCLMEPSKSLSGFFFKSPAHFVPCWVCSFTPCRERQAAYKPDFLDGIK